MLVTQVDDWLSCFSHFLVEDVVELENQGKQINVLRVELKRDEGGARLQ